MEVKNIIKEHLRELKEFSKKEVGTVGEVVARNFDEFNELIAEYKKNRTKRAYSAGAYSAIAKILANAGVVNSKGEPVSRDSVAKAVQQVRRAKGLAKTAKPKDKAMPSQFEDMENWAKNKGDNL